MADQRFQNVINGELVDSVSGETYDIVDPTTGEVYAAAPRSGAEDVDRAYGAAAAAFESWARPRQVSASRRCSRSRTRSRSAPTSSCGSSPRTPASRSG
jgi:acyl-CoA reductase-like NAD-dependent aldehyde dehydrogenase